MTISASGDRDISPDAGAGVAVTADGTAALPDAPADAGVALPDAPADATADPAGAACLPHRGLPAARSRHAQAGRRAMLAGCIAAAAACCLVIALLAGARARALQDRAPSAAQRSAAAAVAVAQRWRTWPAGRIFPARLGYTTVLLTRETARRAGIAAGSACGAAMDAAAARQALRDGCRAALRASYADELQGIIYTVGVIVFARPSGAAAFLHAIAAHLAGRPAGRGGESSADPPSRHPGDFSVALTAVSPASPRYALRAHPVAGTAAARFGSAARQVMTGRRHGVYVVLTVAGYADGRPSVPAGNRRYGIFRPAIRLAAEILAPLAAPPEVSCASPEWLC